jgi:hypothetical protein
MIHAANQNLLNGRPSAPILALSEQPTGRQGRESIRLGENTRRKSIALQTIEHLFRPSPYQGQAFSPQLFRHSLKTLLKSWPELESKPVGKVSKDDWKCKAFSARLLPCPLCLLARPNYIPTSTK